MIAALALIATAPDGVPPPTLRGPHYACRMTARSGEQFTVSGELGSGRRVMRRTADSPSDWFYRFSDARIVDSQAGFSGAPILATSTSDTDHPQVTVRYLAGRNGRRIDIGEDGHARLTEDNTGDVLADGICRLAFEPRVASRELEIRR